MLDKRKKEWILILIKPLNKKQSDYLTYVLESSYCQRQLKPSGTALKHIYLKDLRTLSIPIGSVEINKLIVTKLDEIQKLIKISNASVEKSLKALNDLKSVILVDTFKCEIA